MKSHHGRKKLLIFLSVAAVITIVVGVSACAPKANTSTVGNPTPNVQKSTETPTPDKFGVVKAEQWADAYPYEYQSYLENYNNNEEGKANYLETNPEILTLGKGYGYAKYYTEPLGHVYALETIANNGRVNANSKAQCLTCKSPQYSNLVDAEGDSVNQRNMWEVLAELDEPISCASCHANDPMTLEVDRHMWTVAMGSDADTAPIEGQVCGQCHCDYSMDPVTGVPTSPYDNGRQDMVPEKALAWYDSHGYADWTYESTGAQMIAVRHAEYEFVYGGEGNHMSNLGYNCNDCHMATVKADDGTVYTSHYWISPTENDELIERDCSSCHADLKAEVKAIQEEIDGRTTQVGQRAERFVKNFEAAIEDNSITDEQKSRLQYIQRASCYYWNLASAENSEGAHNPELYTSILDQAEAYLDEGDAILGVSSKADA